MSSDTVPRWPRIDAIVREDGSGEVTIDGTFHPITTGSLEEARVEVLRRVTENAVQVGRPVRASATGPEGLWNLIVHPDGTVVPEEDEFAPPSSPTPQAPPAGATLDQSAEPTATPGPVFDDVPARDLPPRGEPAPADPLGTPDAFGTADPVDPTDRPGAADPARTADPTTAAGPAADQDPIGSSVESDPEDTVRRAPRPSEAPGAVPPGTTDSETGPAAPGSTASGSAAPGSAAPGASAPGSTTFSPNGGGRAAAEGTGVADWVRESATDGSRGGVTHGPASGSLPGRTTNSPANGTTGSVLSPMSGPVDAVPTAGSAGYAPGAPAGTSPPTWQDAPEVVRPGTPPAACPHRRPTRSR